MVLITCRVTNTIFVQYISVSFQTRKDRYQNLMTKVYTTYRALTNNTPCDGMRRCNTVGDFSCLCKQSTTVSLGLMLTLVLSPPIFIDSMATFLRSRFVVDHFNQYLVSTSRASVRGTYRRPCTCITDGGTCYLCIRLCIFQT